MVIFWARCCITLFSKKKIRVAFESRTLIWVPLLQAMTLKYFHIRHFILRNPCTKMHFCIVSTWGHSFWWLCATRVFKRRVYRTDVLITRSWEQIFAKISVFGTEILNANIFEKRKTEGIRNDTRYKKVGLWSGGGA